MPPALFLWNSAGRTGGAER